MRRRQPNRTAARIRGRASARRAGARRAAPGGRSSGS